MKVPACARAWQAEAVLDGRLSRADVLSFERHAATCEVCASEVRELTELSRLAERIPVLTSSPIERRRLRNELLRHANDVVLAPRRTSARRPLIVAATAATIAAALWLLIPSARDTAREAPDFRITTSEGSEWSMLENGATLHLSTRKGSFELWVSKLGAGQRFLLELPDGELEVQGTRFVVDVDGERTRSVRVLEGRVALRLREQDPLVLHAGDSWPAELVLRSETVEADAPGTPEANDVAPQASDTSPGGAETFDPKLAQRPAPGRAIPSESDERAEKERSPSGAGSDFVRAMSAFSAGDYGRAEQLFVAFERNHPGDARMEDALFLRAVARLRRGDADGARAIARDYVERYPSGLRKVEAERILGQ